MKEGAEDLEGWAGAGLYDPDSPTAVDRRALLRSLVEQGCTVEEMVAAQSRGRLFALAGDRIIRPERDQYTLAEVAGRFGAHVELVQHVWRALGLVDPGPDVAVAGAADLEIVATCLAFTTLFGEQEAIGVIRVIGASAARVAEAASSLVLASPVNVSIELRDSEFATSQLWASLAPAVPATGRVLGIVLGHHIESVIRHSEQAGAGERGRTLRLGVGFADLSGFTALSQVLTLEELSALLADFEEWVHETVAAEGGRVVKFIGDAAMFCATDPDVLARIGWALTDGRDRPGHRLAARAGLAYGDLLTQEGDYFGMPVNLAARLVAAAEPGTVLADAAAAGALDPDRWEVSGLPARTLRGFPEPVAPFALRRRT